MKKTRKQKILAELHRLKTESYSLPEIAVQYTTPVASTSPKSDYSSIASGLKQTAVLALLAICAQLVLWYLNGMKHWF